MARAHEVVMEWVTNELASGRLRIGDHLPGERTLAETLGVSRSSLREAFRVLEALGTIRSATGSGPKSGTVVTAAPEQALTLALNLQLATSHVEHSHIVEVRVLLETWAALHPGADNSDWQPAEHLLQLMDDPKLSVEEFLTLDAQFHVVLSKAAGNPLVSTLMEALRTSVATHTASRAQELHDWRATAQRLRDEHRHILDALSAGNRDAAAQLIQSHIEGYYREPSAPTPALAPRRGD